MPRAGPADCACAICEGRFKSLANAQSCALRREAYTASAYERFATLAASSSTRELCTRNEAAARVAIWDVLTAGGTQLSLEQRDSWTLAWCSSASACSWLCGSACSRTKFSPGLHLAPVLPWN